jgi:hypothetical protein
MSMKRRVKALENRTGFNGKGKAVMLPWPKPGTDPEETPVCISQDRWVTAREAKQMGYKLMFPWGQAIECSGLAQALTCARADAVGAAS